MKGQHVSEAAITIIESMGLRRGRGQINSVVSRSAARQPHAEAGEPSPRLAPAELKAYGPINRFMYLEARNWAIDLVATLRGSPAELVIERLAGAAVGRPGSYVAGIQSVIDELKAAVATGDAENENLTSQAGRKE